MQITTVIHQLQEQKKFVEQLVDNLDHYLDMDDDLSDDDFRALSKVLNSTVDLDRQLESTINTLKRTSLLD